MDKHRDDDAAAIPPDSPDWRREPPSTGDLRLDALIAAGMFCGAVLAFMLFRVMGVYEEPAGPMVSLLTLFLVTAPLALRRSHPISCAALVSIAIVFIGELQVPEMFFRDIALFLAIYSLGAWSQHRRAASWARWGIVVAMALWLLISFFRASLDPEFAETESAIAGAALTPALATMLYQLLVNIMFFAAAIWFGHHSWESARNRARLAERAQQLRAEQATVAEQAASLERMRIARELHDSVAHHVSLMGVQATAARTVLTHDAETATRSIRFVEDSARQAVTELHSMLGVLRDQQTPGASSSLGVDQLGHLAQDAERGGIRVSVHTEGEPRPLRQLVSLALYRIAQESLTNVRKHAGTGAQAKITLRYRPDSVELEITDDGGGRRRAPAPGDAPGGHGIIGMAERATAAGGTLTAEPQSQGGFLVRAELPLEVTELSGAEPVAAGKTLR